MPPVSEAQRAAMAEAATGNSSIGIPKKVGREFMKADHGGKLPEHKEKRKPPSERLYGKGKKVKSHGR